MLGGYDLIVPHGKSWKSCGHLPYLHATLLVFTIKVAPTSCKTVKRCVLPQPCWLSSNRKPACTLMLLSGLLISAWRGFILKTGSLNVWLFAALFWPLCSPLRQPCSYRFWLVRCVLLILALLFLICSAPVRGLRDSQNEFGASCIHVDSLIFFWMNVDFRFYGFAGIQNIIKASTQLLFNGTPCLLNAHFYGKYLDLTEQIKHEPVGLWRAINLNELEPSVRESLNRSL